MRRIEFEWRGNGLKVAMALPASLLGAVGNEVCDTHPDSDACIAQPATGTINEIAAAAESRMQEVIEYSCTDKVLGNRNFGTRDLVREIAARIFCSQIKLQQSGVIQ